MSKPILPSGIDIAIREDLAEGTSRTQTTLIIDPILTLDGTRVTMTTIGAIGFAKIDQGGTREEIISFTGITDNSTTYTLTGCLWGYKFDDQSSQDTDNRKQHTSGGSFQVMTDQHFICTNYVDNQTAETVAGVKTFSSSPIVPAPTTDLQAATKKYADDLAIAGAPDASTTVKGISKMSTAPASATNPIAVGDNDNRVPTFNENNALEGTGTPSSSNKFVTADTIVDKPDFIETFFAGETINGATLPVPVCKITGDKKIYACDANDTTKLSFIGFAISDGILTGTIRVQLGGLVEGFTGLTDTGVTKYYVQDDKTIGTAVGTYNILVGEAVGTTNISITRKSLVANGNGLRSTGTGSQVITHNLDKIPSLIKLYAVLNGASGATSASIFSIGNYSDGLQNCIAYFKSGAPDYSGGLFDTNIGYIADAATPPGYVDITVGTITSTQFTLTFDNAVGDDQNIAYIWDAQ